MEDQHTIRQKIVDLLAQGDRGAREISQAVGIPEKQVYDHLEHIARSLKKTGAKLVINPFKCRSCGYVFRERSRFDPPGRCPACRGTWLEKPTYGIRGSSVKKPA